MTIEFKKFLKMKGGEAGTLSCRLVENILNDKLVKPLDRLRLWAKAGFAMAELGHGIIERYVAQEEEAGSASLSKEQRAIRLINIIQSTEWTKKIADTETIITRENDEVRLPEVKAPELPEPVNTAKPGVTTPKVKKRRPLANIVG